MTTPGVLSMITEWPRWFTLLAALVMVGFIAWIDSATGWEWSFFAFYAFPIALVVWRMGRRPGIAVVGLCTVAWWVSYLGNNPYQSHGGFAMALAGRWCYFAAVAVAAAAVKSQRDSAQAQIESLERERETEKQFVLAGEREQQRRGRDLHDSLGPHLAALGYAATFLADDLRLRGQPEAEKAEHLRVMAAGAVALARDLARGIFPVQTDGIGLSVALEDLARTTTARTELPVSFQEIGDTRIADPEAGTHLYRIATEAVNNAVKHSGAGKVTIVLSRSEKSLRLAVADDGNGMALSLAAPQGMGLRSMRFRARVLGGELQIESSPGEGTAVSCEVPFPPARPKTSS